MNAASTVAVKVEPGGRGVVGHVGVHALGAFAGRMRLGDWLSVALPCSGERAPLHDRGKGRRAGRADAGGRWRELRRHRAPACPARPVRCRPLRLDPLAGAARVGRAGPPPPVGSARLGAGRAPQRRRAAVRSTSTSTPRSSRSTPIRAQGAGRRHLQGRLRLPSAAVLCRRHRGVPGGDAAAGQRRRQHRSGPRRRPRSGARPAARFRPRRAPPGRRPGGRAAGGRDALRLGGIDGRLRRRAVGPQRGLRDRGDHQRRYPGRHLRRRGRRGVLVAGATRQSGEVREGSAVCELTSLVDLSSWPAGTRLIVRREPLHPCSAATAPGGPPARRRCAGGSSTHPAASCGAHGASSCACSTAGRPPRRCSTSTSRSASSADGRSVPATRRVDTGVDGAWVANRPIVRSRSRATSQWALQAARLG